MSELDLSRKDFDAVLAGLRLLQCALDSGEVEPNDGDVGNILTCDGDHEGLDAAGIDALCENLNGSRGLVLWE